MEPPTPVTPHPGGTVEAMFVHVVGKIVVKGILTAQLEEGFRQTGERLQGRHEQPRYDMFQSLRHRALRQTLRASAFHRSAAALAGAAASRCATSYTSTETRFMADRRANHAPTGQDWPPVAADAPAPRVGVTPKDWPLLPECIQTPRLLLRRYRLTDAEDVYAYARDPEWGRFLITIEPPYERQHADAFVAECVLEDRRTEHTWALEHEGRVVGGLGLRPVHRHARAELGYSLARWLWSRGLMTEAVSAVVDEAFPQTSNSKDLRHCDRRKRRFDASDGESRHAARGAAAPAPGAARPDLRRSSIRAPA